MLNCMETLSVKVGRSEKVYVSWCENTVSESLLAVHCVEGYAGWSTKGYTEGFTKGSCGTETRDTTNCTVTLK